MRKRLALEEKQKTLGERQERLRAVLTAETVQLESEMRGDETSSFTFRSIYSNLWIILDQQRPRSRQASNSILESVRQTLSNAEECKKRADMESTLYSRWRLGMDQEKILKESKNNHQAFAKLSWLDRQLENQLQNERHRQENNVLELKLEEEKRKHEAYVQSCSQLRDSEISQLKTLQEGHIQELKIRDRESHDLKLMESTLRKKLGEIQKEIDNISTINNKRRDRVQALHNYRKIKMIMRERSDAVRRDLQQDLNLLDRISFDRDFDNNEEIDYLRQKFQGQHDVEAQNIRHIESMYESEAKDSLKKQEEKWNDDAMVRERQLKVLMDDRVQTINDRVNECVRQQQDMQSLRETHLKAIEECNQRLKDLMHSSLTTGITEETNKPFVTNNIRSTSSRQQPDNLSINGQQYELTVPKFGRKKIAWT